LTIYSSAAAGSRITQNQEEVSKKSGIPRGRVPASATKHGVPQRSVTMPSKRIFGTALGLTILCTLVPGYAAGPAPILKPHIAQDGTAQNALLNEIVEWLTTNFELRASFEHPRVALVPPMQLVAMRYKGLLPQEWREDLILDPRVQAAQHREVAAIYNDSLRTIFLPHGWSGATAAEQSILVHEMVHHLQNLAGEKFECAEERERLAYKAQNEWLGRTGRTLESEFALDPMTLLLASRCMH
jgi:hypothetical protein